MKSFKLLFVGMFACVFLFSSCKENEKKETKQPIETEAATETTIDESTDVTPVEENTEVTTLEEDQVNAIENDSIETDDDRNVIQKTGDAISTGAKVTGDAIVTGANATGNAVATGAKATGKAVSTGANVVAKETDTLVQKVFKKKN